jgi:hypothetical protein
VLLLLLLLLLPPQLLFMLLLLLLPKLKRGLLRLLRRLCWEGQKRWSDWRGCSGV